MPILEAAVVDLISAGITASAFTLEISGLRRYVSHWTNHIGNTLPLSKDVRQFSIRKDSKDPNRVVNVFEGSNKIYTIERKTRLYPNWSVLTVPGRKEKISIRTGLWNKDVEFHEHPDIEHRKLVPSMGILGQTMAFYLDDGARYEWSRASKYLEKVINPGGGLEETRIRVARAKLMRRFRLDFELTVDETLIDSDVAIATAFIAIISQWGFGDDTDTTGPTFIANSVTEDEITTEAVQEIEADEDTLVGTEEGFIEEVNEGTEPLSLPRSD